MLGRGFAHHPAHSIDHIRLTAAIGADDTGEISGQIQGSRIDKRLEAGEFDLAQAHWIEAFPVDKKVRSVYMSEAENRQRILRL